MMPSVGDTLTYSVSTGERVTMRTMLVSQVGDRVVATDEETIARHGLPIHRGLLRIIRTSDALAFDLPSVNGESLSPLVFYFSRANPKDSWLAQRVSYLDATGRDVKYQVLANFDSIETINAPAGTFARCWRLTFSASSDPTDRLTVWLDPDIGIVKTQSRERGETIVTQLTSVALAGAR